MVGKGENAFPAVKPLPNKPDILCDCSISLLKSLWEEKLLKASNFSISHIVFYVFEELSAICIKVKIVSENSSSLEESKICTPFPNDKY